MIENGPVAVFRPERSRGEHVGDVFVRKGEAVGGGSKRCAVSSNQYDRETGRSVARFIKTFIVPWDEAIHGPMQKELRDRLANREAENADRKAREDRLFDALLARACATTDPEEMWTILASYASGSYLYEGGGDE